MNVGREIAARFSVAEHARFMHRIYAGVIEERARGRTLVTAGAPEVFGRRASGSGPQWTDSSPARVENACSLHWSG